MPARGLFGLAALAAACLPGNAQAAGFDGSSPFLCAPLEIASCGSGADCNAESAEDINLPPFIRVNAGDSSITGKRPDGQALSTKILGRQSSDGRLVLQGLENGLSWTISIDEEQGRMTIVAAGDRVAFIAFGACILP